MLFLALAQGPELVRVGRVQAIYWPGGGTLATALAEYADRPQVFPGLPPDGELPITIMLAPGRDMFDSLTRGRLPHWGAGAAFPDSRTIVLRVAGDPMRILRHELAHLALHARVRRPPVWLSEGYAVRAAGEWDRLDALRVNWSLVRGRVPGLVALNRDLRGGDASARGAYALAATAVLLLERMGGEAGLTPFLDAMSETGDADWAMRRVYGLTLDQFETRWRDDVRSRYGWLALLGAFSFLWLVGALVFGAVWYRRRRRDRARRLRIGEGWEIPDDDWAPGA